ncbi:bifunctional diguanylate cyclase/phosphodiesterase [Geobacter sp. AOG2]|uniref:putative bifunctional diguanylate cyclase/phosphodiesterase n=1 Tax=Geobacter sp. AOG2 TaxID=1566347 RepID=UPI001CC50988|nr:GGDEF domain-containing response regulator [Geobacter sp. AOG2]GFE62442.1 two-component system response regulator [Geobacter sp. AOG2]
MTGSPHTIKAGSTILIIEDDIAFAELTSATVQEHGFKAIVAASGREAMELLAATIPSLIILDYSLPDMTGIAILEQISGRGLSVPFIMVTGRDDALLAVQMMKTGACDYLLKDTSFLDRLPAAVLRTLYDAETRERLRRAEESLRQSETRLARAQKIARMGSWEWNPLTGETYWSDELYRILGFTPGDPAHVEMDWFIDLINEADQAAFKKVINSAARQCQPFSLIYRIKSQNGDELVVNSQAEVERDGEGRAQLVSGTTLDITARIRAENEIQQLINYDTLTSLPNRTLLHDRLRHAIAQAVRDRQMVGVLFLDLDRFKGINETLGHRAGDKLLKTIAKRLKACVRETDTLARIGGDEFAIVLMGVSSEEVVTAVTKKILGLISEPIFIDGHEIYTTGSIGIALYPMDGEDGATLLKHADQAMYQAKERDGNNFQFFSSEMNIKVLERMMLENSLRKALERGDLFLLYQPQVNTRTGTIIGLEALIRWNHPDLGVILPDKFIYLAEETGLIIPIGEWVLRTACFQAKSWQQQGFAPMRMAVNLSAKQFAQKNLDDIVAAILLESGLDPNWLELEITESTIMKNPDSNTRMLHRLKDMGISLAIDDFGTGYSSLSYLKHFPINRLKIDRMFVRDIAINPDDAAIVEIIISMAHTLKLSVTAEGVETRPLMEFLSSRNCAEMQGYLFSRPVRAEEITKILENGLKY